MAINRTAKTKETLLTIPTLRTKIHSALATTSVGVYSFGSSPNRVGNFWGFSLPHQSLLQRAFHDMTRPNLPTHLGEDPKGHL